MANGMAGTSPTTGGPLKMDRNINPRTQAPYKNTIGDLRAMQRSGQELSPFQINRLENAPGQDNLERVSPGVYRNQQGQLVNPQGQQMPQQPQMPQGMVQFQPYKPPMGMGQGVAQGLGNYLQQNPGYIFNKPNSNFNVDMSQMQPYGSPQFANQPMMRPAVMPSYNPFMTGMAAGLPGQNK